MNLYVYYTSHAAGGWVAPAATQGAYEFGIEPHHDDKRVATREHLAAFETLAAGGAFSAEAMLALHSTWRGSYVRAATSLDDVDRLRDKTATALAAVTSCTPETVRGSPLCMWPCYAFLVEPTPI